ncbi:testis-expressed sequence 9 protein-like isoform X2 [Poecilia formosa]|nr:PREDICTED: testis-expressed sequence 9 protein-like isoform X2 [Poecilia formosa]
MQDPGMKYLANKRVSITEKYVDADQEEKEEKINDCVQEKAAAFSDHETRVLRTKLHIVQEELDLLSTEYHNKNDEFAKLFATNKRLGDDQARLQKTIDVQEVQIKEQKASIKDLAQICHNLHLQVYDLNELVKGYDEEVDRMNSQLTAANLAKKKKVLSSEENLTIENLLAENKLLKKQKYDLISGFKKQAKLIDILKRHIMHVEAAKLLSFTEDEFIKAMLKTQ